MMRSRGYALAIVLLVSVLLSVALSTMFFALGSATKVTAKNLGTRRAQYICDGVVALASAELRRASTPQPTSGGRFGFNRFSGPGITIEQLNDALDPLRRGVEADGVVIDELRVDLSGDQRLSVVPSGGLAGLEVTVVDLDLKIGLRSPDAPPCNARQVQPMASLSLFQFPAFSVDNLDVVVPFRQSWDLGGGRDRSYVWGRNSANVDITMIGVEGRSSGSAALTLPAPQAPLEANDLRFWAEQPDTGFPADRHERAGSRVAFDADLRIIDGEWYLRDPNRRDSWPGILIWSDHPCTDPRDVGKCSNIASSASPQWSQDVAIRRLYSRYERNARGFLDGAVVGGSGAGVVSYGSLVRQGELMEPAGFLSGAVCTEAGFKTPFECTGKVAGSEGRRAALADAARGGFNDPSVGPRLPINIDVGALGSALATRGSGEIGDHVCLPRSRDDPGACPRVFNGIVYVSAKKGSAITSPPTTIDAIPANPATGSKLPWALCGALARTQASLDHGEFPGVWAEANMGACDDETNFAKIDAVRLVRAGNLAAFKDTGLTIVTDLPLFLVGDWNGNGAGGVRTAMAGDRLTVLSVLYSDANAPQLGAANFPAPADNTRVRVTGSFFGGSPTSDPGSMVRVIEPGVDVVWFGALARAFTTRLTQDRRPDSFTWSYPPDLLKGASTAHPPGAPRGSFILPGARR